MILKLADDRSGHQRVVGAVEARPRRLAFDRAAAAAFGQIAASRRAAGRPVSVADGQIAAIARARGPALVATRDASGFEGCGVVLNDSWQP